MNRFRWLIALPFALALLLAGCADRAEARQNAELRVLALGTPETDRDHVTKALLEATLAMRALQGSESEYRVLDERRSRLASDVGITIPDEPNEIGAAVAASDRFDERGGYRGESMALHGLCQAIHLGAENAWTEYERGWF